MPIITDPLMAQGEFRCDFSYDPALDEDLADYRILQFYWGEELIYAGPILRRTVSRDQITVMGRSPLWYLGSPDNRGPLIDDREYLSGQQKLSNGDFELGTDGGTINPDGTIATNPTVPFWTLNQSTNWVVLAGIGPHSGTWSAGIATETDTGDDVLQSSEKFDAAPGQVWYLQAYFRRPQDEPGHLRFRIVFEGFYRPPNLMDNPGFESGWTSKWKSSDPAVAGIIDDATEAHSGSWVIKMFTEDFVAPTVNAGFETGDLTGWVAVGGAPYSATGTQHAEGAFCAAHSGATSGGTDSLQANSNYLAAPTTVSPFPCNPGETWRFEGCILIGTGPGQPNPGAMAWVRFLVLDAGSNAVYVDVLEQGGADNSALWHSGMVNYVIPDGKVGLVPMCVTSGKTTGAIYFDLVRAIRSTGNTSTMTGPPITVTPERVYKWQAWVRTGPNFSAGTLQFVAQFFGPDRAPSTVASGPTQSTNNTWQQVTFELVPPTGMTAVIPSYVVTDVAGDAFYIDDVTFVDEDYQTVVFDQVTPPTQPDWAVYGVEATAPDGTQFAYVEVIAEGEGIGWHVDDIFLSRPTSTPATAGQIIRDCLTNPLSGSRFLNVGTIHGDQPILYDIRVRNQTNKALLDHLSKSGLVLPQREYRANPDLTFDWGRDVELFADRTDIVLAPNDFHLLADPAVEVSMEERVTRLKFLGADRQAPNGIKTPLTAQALNVTPDAVDAFGQPLERALLAQDSSIDQLPVAVSYAAYQAGRNNNPKQAIQVQLADWRAWGRFDVGDWIYLYKPEAGLEDLTQRETKLDDGRIVFPARKRVLSRTWHLGSGPFKVFVVDPANRAEPIDVTDAVRWERDTVAQLDVGEMLPEFAIDPEGGNADVQFLRYRSSITR